jgi:hypothetical protein
MNLNKLINRNMKSLILFLPILLASTVKAQNIPTDGLEINDSIYNAIETANMLYEAELLETSPKSFSMRIYCFVLPVVASGGLSWTTAISKAMGIQLGYEKQWSPEQVESQAFSPYFLFDLLPKASPESCLLHKDWIKQTQDLLTSTGNIRLSDYRQKAADCHRQPPRELLNTVDRYRIRAMTRLFVSDQEDERSSIGQKQFVMKRSLSRKHPVVLCLMTGEEFTNLKTEQWTPGKDTKTLQAVVVTGYDDQRQAFEIAHPIGKNWGQGGFAWIRYADLRHAKYAFEITMEDRPTVARENKNSNPGHQKTTIVNDSPGKAILQGSLVLTTINPEGNYVPVTLTSNPKGYYEPDRRYDVLSQFQLLGTGAARSYLYVLGVDPEGRAQLHYPQQKGQLTGTSEIASAMLSEIQSQVVIPAPILSYDANGTQIRKEQVFIKEQQGTDWLAAIYSNKKMDQEIRALVQELNGHGADFLSRFQQVFAKFLAPKSLVYFEKDRMKFKTGTLSEPRAVPVILKLEGN